MAIHIMLDLETMGTRPSAPILQIGLVAWNSKTGEQEDARFDMLLSSACDHGATIEPRTVLWWVGAAGKEAQVAILQAQTKASSTGAVLDAVDRFVAQYNNAHDEVFVWGNGAMLDNTLLEETYRRAGREPPWGFRSNMCYRTIKNCFPNIKAPPAPTDAVYHDALHDARYQMEHLKLLLLQHAQLDPAIVLPTR